MIDSARFSGFGAGFLEKGYVNATFHGIFSRQRQWIELFTSTLPRQNPASRILPNWALDCAHSGSLKSSLIIGGESAKKSS